MTRREFVNTVAWTASGSLIFPRWMPAGTLPPADWDKLVPADKKLDPEWVKSLFARGQPTIYRGADLEKIGMPIGGICAGQLYLGGDGRLWHWDIFNDQIATGDAHYAHPLLPAPEVDQGFALRVNPGGTPRVWPLDAKGFREVTFRGQYPIGTVNYRDPACPVEVEMEAFSPFAPLQADDSSLPATVMVFTLKNTGSEPVEVELAGWLENAICRKSGELFSGTRHNSRIADKNALMLACGVRRNDAPAVQPDRPQITVADFEGNDWGGWKAEGTAFGSGPAHGAPNPTQKLTGFEGKALANSWALGSDGPTGKLTSPPFTIERRYLNFLIGGGSHRGPDGSVATGVNLLVDGKIVRTATGQDSDAMAQASWNVSEFEGKTAVIEIVDASGGPWGHIEVAQIELADTSPLVAGELTDQSDAGTMVLALLEPQDGDRMNPAIEAHNSSAGAFVPDAGHGEAERDMGPGPENKLAGSVARRFRLAAGESRSATFVLAWHFPNLIFPLTFVAGAPRDHVPVEKGRYYATRFDSARSVAAYVAENAGRLLGQTRLWRDTWYDSTLPWWFLDRTLLNISTLATNTAYRFANGRFYGWEGVGSCPGTCTHVWSYEQAMGRLFPELDILLRERADYNPAVSFDPATGMIGNRGEVGRAPAADGQAGTILRTYRDHLVSPDAAFLRRNWPDIRKAVAWLFTLDGKGDGILDRPQANTLDAVWYGKVPWITGLALAAFRAGEKMAEAVGDAEFAAKCRTEADRGRDHFVSTFWNGAYFEQIPDPAKLDQIGSYNGCEIDQVLGQSWAFQVGLGRVLPEKETRAALQAIWKYSFAPDVGPFRAKFKEGRLFAMPGEAGTLMCSWPRGDKLRVAKGFDFYFNECMNGFEHQVAGHMIREGMLLEGLAIERAVHDRYDASKRNPWNEIECGDHYARSMASYGVFLAACGFEYDGPAGHLGFAPALTPENFRAAFTAAEGWGGYSQRQEGEKMTANLALKWGKLRLRSLAFAVKNAPGAIAVSLNGQPLQATHSSEAGRLVVSLSQEITLQANDRLETILG